MAPIPSVVFGGLVATYLFVRFYLHITQDAREPPAIETHLPFLGPFIRMIKEKHKFHIHLRCILAYFVLKLVIGYRIGN